MLTKLSRLESVGLLVGEQLRKIIHHYGRAKTYSRHRYKQIALRYLEAEDESDDAQPNARE